MMQTRALTGVPDLRIVVFQWSAKDGECLECGLPAAYFDRPYRPKSQDKRKLCSVCAAESASEGETIERIDPNF